MQTKHILHCHHLIQQDTQQAKGHTVLNAGAKETRQENDEGYDAKISIQWGCDGWLQAGCQIPLPKM